MELKKRTLMFWCVIASLLYMRDTEAANPTLPPNSIEFWNGAAAVVIGKIESVIRTEGSNWDVTIEPRFCVAGLFNPAEHPKLLLDYGFGMNHWHVPQKDELVLAVIINREKLSIPRPGFAVVLNASFTPDGAPLVLLKGSDDPIILEVLHKMQAARPTTAATTLPRNN